MSDASAEVLLDDFEKKDRWELAGAGADRTHITTFAEGAPSKPLGVYPDGAAGADYRALVLLVRSAADDLEVELVAKPGRSITVPGQLSALNLWVRSPHAAIRVSATLGDDRTLLLGKVSADGEWQRVTHTAGTPIANATLVGLKVHLTDVVKHEGEVMILLDDLTAHTTP
ncbi:hypothetical protein [Nocardia sp. NPDC052566]|uniref:hypothetical protein n=1 Tax=Nocardia sp. NPDC052566 TaxID=3364330 RepID=UPI0037C70D89